MRMGLASKGSNDQLRSLGNTIFIDREAREIMYLVASVRPSVCLSVRLFVRLSVCAHNQSEEFVCVSNNRADAVDRLLIAFGFHRHSQFEDE